MLSALKKMRAAISPSSQEFYYMQTQPFTCGPSSLIMALSYLGKIQIPEDYLLEVEFWRQANTVYMGKDHPGCGPYGLALLARAHGCDVTVLRTQSSGFFKRWNEMPRKRDLELKLEEYDMNRAIDAGCQMAGFPADGDSLLKLVGKNSALVALTGKDKTADGHWVCALPTSRGFTVMDPAKEDYHPIEKQISKLSADEFYQKTHYLKQRVVLVISPQS